MQKNYEVHVIDYRNKKIVVDINSSNTFFINSLDEKLLEKLDKFSENEITNHFSDDYKIENIKKSLDNIKKNVTFNAQLDNNYNLEGYSYTLILHHSRKCNLNCKYCFGNEKNISDIEIDIDINPYFLVD